MARRERTTGLPRPRRRDQTTDGRRFAALRLDENAGRAVILSAAAALLVAVLLVFAANWYHESIGHGRETILRVADEQFTLNYYSDRLYQLAQETQDGSASVDTQLLNKLEEEALITILARERGVDLGKSAVDNQIAQDIGVFPVAGTGSPYDRAYRDRLEVSKLSNASFRRMEAARLAEAKLRELILAEVGANGEAIQIRLVVATSKEAGDDVLRRVQEGENLGTIAQTESADLESRQKDGLQDHEPLAFFPESVRALLADASAGKLLGPVQVGDNYWVLRLEERDPAFVYTDSQKADLTTLRLRDAVQAKRTSVTIRRTIDSGDIAWAFDNARN